MGNRITAVAIFGVVIGALVIVLAFQVDAPPRTPTAPSGQAGGSFTPPSGLPWIPPVSVLPSQPLSPEPVEPPSVSEPPAEPLPPPAQPQFPPAPTGPSGPVSQLLPLPTVADGELALSQSGASTLAAYLEQLAARGGELPFDGEKINELPKNTGGFPLLVADLAEAAIRTGGFAGVRASLQIYEELITAKIAWEKTIPVRTAAVVVNKTVIGADLLTLDLIRKAYAVGDGTLSGPAFEAYYGRYQATVDFYRAKLRREGGVSYRAPERDSSEFMKLFRVFGLSPEIARAVGLSFGGFITAQFNCTCNGGFSIFLSPGYSPAPGAFFIFYYYWFLGNPLLFLNHAPFPGHWILGDYLPAPGACRHDPPDCSPINTYIGIIQMAGTS